MNECETMSIATWHPLGDDGLTVLAAFLITTCAAFIVLTQKITDIDDLVIIIACIIIFVCFISVPVIAITSVALSGGGVGLTLLLLHCAKLVEM